MITTYFTPQESKAFAALAAPLREGIAVEQETLTYADTLEDRQVRFEVMRLHDSALLSLRSRVLEVTSDQDFLSLAKSIDLSKMSDHDMTQLLFALGPDAMTAIIEDLFERATTREDSELISSFGY